MKTNKTFSIFDQLITQFDAALRTITNVKGITTRDNPAAKIKQEDLSKRESKHSAALMRVNHAGEIAAQALYQGQAFVAKDKKLQAKLLQAGAEEHDHLSWCHDRVTQLNEHTSFLAPLWYSGAFCIGAVAGLAGDEWSLGFLAETEQQVVKHLQGHLEILPVTDNKSKIIIKQMIKDETEHATMAMQSGASELPVPIKIVMQAQAKVMTMLAYYV